MEMYLPRNIDSFIASNCCDDIELIIVNDGSTDRTLEVAKKYQMRYPKTIKIIDKPNGHYGSCVNAALKVSQGKYFRIVDADDWVDPTALKRVVEILPNVNTDVVYTRFSSFYEGNGKLETNAEPIEPEWNKPVLIDTLEINFYLHMHQLWYRTDFLKSIKYKQTEGVCYTDTEYVFIPLSNAKDIYAIKESVYQYYVGREDQSMSTSVLMKNFKHLNKVFQNIYKYSVTKFSNRKSEDLRIYYLSVLFGMMIDCLYASQCKNTEWNDMMREASQMLSSKNVDLSKYLNQEIRGCKWFKWWYENTFLSNVKLRLLFFLINLRYNKK